MKNHDVLVIGSGIYGVTTALELNRRGYDVGILEQGTPPHPLAASTDISKVVRMEYGADREYMALVDEAITGWHLWNEHFADTLYHECGVTMFTRTPMEPGEFEYESYHNLLERGHQPERLDAEGISERFPAWKAGSYVDGFFNPRGGFVESGRVVSMLLEHARDLGVTLYTDAAVTELVRTSGRISEARTQSGDSHVADHYVTCAGTWTQHLLPELQSVMKSTGHPVFHLKPDDPKVFQAPDFVVFTAAISKTGWYGFPLHPSEGVIKIANHGIGHELHPDSDVREVTEDDIQHLRVFLAETFPDLVEAPIVYTRRCLYADTLDEHLWIDAHPELQNLTVGAGGSGHALKLGPVLGPLIADALERKPNPYLDRFRWRAIVPGTGGKEEARFHQ